jgi:hypothetical protein
MHMQLLDAIEGTSKYQIVFGCSYHGFRKLTFFFLLSTPDHIFFLLVGPGPSSSSPVEGVEFHFSGTGLIRWELEQ